MYPQRELNRLAAHKRTLRPRIALRREACAAAAGRAVVPLRWLDRMLAFWRGLPPLAKAAVVPLGLVAQRLAAPRLNVLGTFLRWSPLAFAAFRGLRSAKTARSQNPPRTGG